MNVPEALRQVDLFADLPEERIAWLTERAEILELEDGEEFVHMGDSATRWHVIAEGGVDWLMPVEGAPTSVNHMEAVTYTGTTACLTGEPIIVTGRAAGATTLLRYTDTDLMELVRDEPEVLREIVRQFRPMAARIEAITHQREKLASLGALSAGLAHEINNPAAAARRATEALGRSVDVLRGGAKRLGGLPPEQLERIVQLACAEAHGTAGGDPLEQADREEALADWLEAHDVPDAFRLAGELSDVGLDATWAAAVADAAGPGRLSEVLPWAVAGATTGGLLAELTDSLTRVSDLVAAIKAYSYMDQAPGQELDVHEGLESTLTMLGHKLKRTSTTVRRDYDETLPRITGAGGELNQVWTNLIDNAIAAAGEGGRLTVSTAREADGRVKVTIADDGPGIAPEHRERIFDPFFTTKPVGEGTGLGLDVAYRIVTATHQGEIRVRSEPGDTRFEVLLPA